MRRDVRSQVDIADIFAAGEVNDAQCVAGIRVAPMDAVAIDRHVGKPGLRHDQQFVDRPLKSIEYFLRLVADRIDEQDFRAHFVDADHTVRISVSGHGSAAPSTFRPID